MAIWTVELRASQNGLLLGSKDRKSRFILSRIPATVDCNFASAR
jgi:hypothetical protein